MKNIIIVASMLFWTSFVFAKDDSMVISLKTNQTVNFGDPVIVEITAIFGAPILSVNSHEPQDILSGRDVSMEWEIVSEDRIFTYRDILSVDLALEGESKTEYSGKAILLWKFTNVKGELQHELIFDKPNSYSIVLKCKYGNEVAISSKSNIQVLESSKGKKALEILDSAKDWRYLLYGVFSQDDKTTILSKFDRVIDECDGTVIANICSAHLGNELFNDYQKNNSINKSREMMLEGHPVDEQLLIKIKTLCNKGKHLDDGFAIRDDILFNLARLEFIYNNFDETFNLLDEIDKKHPSSKLHKQAQKAKDELLKFKEK
ncbi:MAG: hypothetical protein GX587_05700 [Bacteroidales bacterium]|nr:hypothetical protein [Bacteroidales bacterium]